MPKKYGYYIINSDIDEIWSKNAMFWKNKKGDIIEQEISDNKLYRVFSFKHGVSMKIYGFAGGQTFTLIFGYLPDENTTLVSAEVKFSILGKGAVWKFPNDIMKEWADFMNVEHINLQNEKNPKMLEIAHRIDDILNNSNVNVEKQHYCPYCGAELKSSEKFCVSCNSDS